MSTTTYNHRLRNDLCEKNLSNVSESFTIDFHVDIPLSGVIRVTFVYEFFVFAPKLYNQIALSASNANVKSRLFVCLGTQPFQ